MFCLANVQIVRPRLGDNGSPANVNGRPEIYTHNHYNIPTTHNVHINHIHIIHENIKVLALGTEAQPINKSIKITQHNMNTLCRYLRHMVERTFPVAVRWELSSTTATNGGSDTFFPSRRRTFPELLSP